MRVAGASLEAVQEPEGGVVAQEAEVADDVASRRALWEAHTAVEVVVVTLMMVQAELEEVGQGDQMATQSASGPGSKTG
jgi:hypothetical protein